MRFLRSSLLLAVFSLACLCSLRRSRSLHLFLQSTSVPLPTSTPLPQRAPLLRVAILDETTTTNVWALFDETGADYWNYATQADYWPRLYHLAPPSLDLEPATAKGEPSPIVCDSATCTAKVTLQTGPDLDGWFASHRR